MPITDISIENFRSFKSLRIQPGRMNVIIGSNAAGKSNIIQAFSFIRDCARHGLENAISLQGGPTFLLNTRIAYTTPLSFVITWLFDDPYVDQVDLPAYENGLFTGSGMTYRFSLSFSGDQHEVQVIDDTVTITGIFRPPENPSKVAGTPIELRIVHENGMMRYLICTPDGMIQDGSCISIKKPLAQDRLLLNATIGFPGMPCLSSLLGGIRVYDFDPRMAKKAIPFTSMADLEENGQNLPLVINRILNDSQKKDLFFTLIKDLLPFVDEIVIDNIMGTNLFFAVREQFDRERTIPAAAISDGTVLIADLIIALFFEENPVCIIEEPERNLHPYLISRVAQMIKDASYNRQIFISTHHPEMVKYVEPADLLLVNRDPEGYSQAFRPVTRREIVEFLDNNIGIDELFIQNLLGME
jgi:predicted ATPase